MIGLIDSGIGGVTVLKEIRKILPKEHFIYYSDSKNNPYGEKTEEEIYEIVKNIVDFLIQKECKIIILACNTASGVCAERLRKEYKNIVLLAIEPAIKVVYDKKVPGLSLVLATPRTLQTQKFLNTYHKYQPEDCILLACPNLANLIEEEKNSEIIQYLQKIYQRYPEAKNFILGCTHYPLIKEKIKKFYPQAQFFDGSKGLSEELKRKRNHINEQFQEEIIEFYDSSHSEIKKERFFKYLEK